MSITEIPPRSPVPAAQPPTAPGGDLYDASGWENAYLEMHDVPALLIQLQDDLSRSRQREAFWISVVVHLAIVILVVNSTRLEGLMHKRSVLLVSAQDLMKEKDLTYLELPPDEQKLTKRPDTNRISDKDRRATSKAPQLDRQELKKILDSARPGRPGPASPPGQSQQPAPPAPAAQEQPSPPPPPDQNQVARLQAPPAGKPAPSFSTGPMSAGSAIEQAARAAISNRGGYGGDGGDYGLGQGKQAGEAIGPLDVLSDTMGVDFGPYLARVLHDVRENWYRIIPESARAPLMKKGKVSIEFAILKDGQVAGLQIVGSSGDVALDRAAYGGITASKPFPPLPTEFGGQYLALRFHFYYNPERSEIQ
ncbi:MAG: TonB C-terminal domain-containing protein [Acidobacteriia bacterium]|nr:TonB C-terminal domain-containing protein [Terriglobia bacterium]